MYVPLYFRRCEWVSEDVLEENYKQALRMYWRRMDPNVPPEVDDGSHEDLITGKIDDKEKVFWFIKHGSLAPLCIYLRMNQKILFE